jgi:hypothetical protein
MRVFYTRVQKRYIYKRGSEETEFSVEFSRIDYKGRNRRKDLGEENNL